MAEFLRQAKIEAAVSSVELCIDFWFKGTTMRTTVQSDRQPTRICSHNDYNDLQVKNERILTENANGLACDGGKVQSLFLWSLGALETVPASGWPVRAPVLANMIS